MSMFREIEGSDFAGGGRAIRKISRMGSGAPSATAEGI
jgi:hypothetical protein